MSFIGTLAEKICRHVQSSLAQSPDVPRFVLRGIPREYHGPLESHLNGKKVTIGQREFAIPQVQTCWSPLKESSLLDQRNAKQGFIACIPPGYTISKSLDSAVLYFGPSEHAIANSDKFCEDPFIHDLVEAMKPGHIDHSKWGGLATAIKHAIDERRFVHTADKKDQRWNLIVRLLDGQKSNDDTDIDRVLMTCGFPKAKPEEIGSRPHLDAMKNVASLFEAKGFDDMFDALLDHVPDDKVKMPPTRGQTANVKD